jgi:hypothetical protein
MSEVVETTRYGSVLVSAPTSRAHCAAQGKFAMARARALLRKINLPQRVPN